MRKLDGPLGQFVHDLGDGDLVSWTMVGTLLGLVGALGWVVLEGCLAC